MKNKKNAMKKIIPACVILLQGTMVSIPGQVCSAATFDNVNTGGLSINLYNKYDCSAMNDTLKNNLQGTNPITFHMDVPPGNYDVTVELGDPFTAGSTSIQGEARRAILGEISTPAGKVSRQTFTINVRDPEAQPTGQGGTGTSGLDLTFSGESPKVSGIKVVPARNPTMIYIAGDSTVCDRISGPYAGWGEMLPQYFKFHTSIANYADCGESSSTFLSTDTLFPAIEKVIKPHDYVLIQFGHNDKTTTAEEYKNNLNTYISECRKVGAIPILVTPPVRRNFNKDNLTLTTTSLHVNSIGVDLPAEMKEVAAENHVPLIDLTSKSKALVESLGVDGCKKLYLTMEEDGVEDHTHFSEYGANEMAKLVVEGIKELHLPLASNLR